MRVLNRGPVEGERGYPEWVCSSADAVERICPCDTVTGEADSLEWQVNQRQLTAHKVLLAGMILCKPDSTIRLESWKSERHLRRGEYVSFRYADTLLGEFGHR